MEKKITIASVLATFGLIQAFFIVNPALGLLAAAHPEMPYAAITLLSTLPTLIAVPTGMMAGALVKKGVGFKPLVLVSILLVMIGGVIPYFITSFASWIIARCIFGIGFGFMSPMGPTMIGMLFAGKRRVQVQGMGTVVQNSFGVIMQILSGLVCMINVDFVWLVHLIFIAPLIVFMIGCPDKAAVAEAVASAPAPVKSEKKGAIPAKVWVISIMFGLGFTCIFGFLLNVASYMQNEGIGNSAMAGVVSALYPAGGIVAGILFPYVRKTLKRWTVPILTLLTAGGMFMGYVGKSAAILCLASFLIGFFTFMIWPTNIVKINGLVDAENMGIANGIFIGLVNVFTFVASFFIQIVLSVMGDNTRNPVVAGAVGLVIIGIFWLFANLKKEY